MAIAAILTEQDVDSIWTLKTIEAPESQNDSNSRVSISHI